MLVNEINLVNIQPYLRQEILFIFVTSLAMRSQTGHSLHTHTHTHIHKHDLFNNNTIVTSQEQSEGREILLSLLESTCMDDRYI